MTRRSALGLLLLAACGGRVAPAPAVPRRTGLRIEPLTDLVPAAGLSWLLDLRPVALMMTDASRQAMAEVVAEDRFAAFASRHGSIDPRAAKELVVASYPEATLTMAEVELDPTKVETAFAARALSVDGRALEGDGDVVRTWGSVAGGSEPAREQIAIVGREALILERGHLGPLRAALAFAEGKLHRALPALHAEPLKRAAELLGDAPARAFAPGPFEGEWAAGLGGLLRASTAAAVSAWPLGSASSGTASLSFRVVLLGAWGADATAAADRLRAAFDVLANDPLGKLMGVDHPVRDAHVVGGADALMLEVGLDALGLARGLHAATAGTVAEIMRF
ncbi:MAG TPA: hypothetical protein VF765_06795 [Polyangiaceae bacterium]